MERYIEKQPINLKVVRLELDFSTLISSSPKPKKKPKKIIIPQLRTLVKKKIIIPNPPVVKGGVMQKRGVNDLVEDLLNELYADQRDWSISSAIGCSQGSTALCFVSSQSNCGDQTDAIERHYLESLDINELRSQTVEWETRLRLMGERLARKVRVRDRMRKQQKRLCAAFNVLLRQISGDSGTRFSVTPSEGGGEGGYAEWLHAMRLVARLPAGVPTHFRRKLWLTLADRHLTARDIDWPAAERACFRGTALPDDAELGAQIIKDLHRTGCSLFCGAEGRENQGMLRRVLLAYARWNKDVGYCQGFNMIAAIILEVMEKSESDSLKVMIYLVEAVLPEGYFADDLRGLSADMAAFRDLLRIRLPKLANHMDHLQRMSDGGGVEPPLPDVFTMQWFLTLYATWLPRESLLRIWDLVLLDGNEILLLTALAIWDLLQDRILSARSADEFYSCMGGGAGAVYEAGDALVARVVAFGSAPELPRLRNLHRYRVTPPAPPTAPPVYQPPIHSAVQTMTKRGLRLFYSEDEGESSDDSNKMALATVIPRKEERLGTGDRLSLDIGALKRQYARLRERQRQAHVILAAACARHAAVGVPTSPTSLTVNNLLLGKSAIVSSRGRRLGPPPGAIPPSRHTSTSKDKSEKRTRVRTTDTLSWKEENSRKYLSRRNSVKWKDIKKENEERIRKASIDLDETGEGVIVSEREANEMIASLRSHSSSETSSYSSHNASSTDTSLCDDNERASDSDHELPDDEKDKTESQPESIDQEKNIYTETIHSPVVNDLLSSLQLANVCKSPDDISYFLRDSKYAHLALDSPKQINVDEPVKDISDYLHSAAGIQLRTYIDGFESKLKESLLITDETTSFSTVSPTKQDNAITKISPHNSKIDMEKEIQFDLKSPMYKDILEGKDLISNTNDTRAKIFTDLSPIDLTPSELGLNLKSPIDQDFLSSFQKSQSCQTDLILRPPDIIDSLMRYPNFVPDIDLSDKNASDIESPPRSPESESVIVSEDEPPIPLKIDKYFEHSPEFFGARLTDPNNTDIPNRRSAKRHLRHPKKPDSLNLHSCYNENIQKAAERASSLPQSHSFTEVIEFQNQSPDKKDKLDKKTFESPYSYQKSQNIDTKDELGQQLKEDYILQCGRKNSERASSLPQSHSCTEVIEYQNQSPDKKDKLDKKTFESPYSHRKSENIDIKDEIGLQLKEDIVSPKDYILQCGRKNSERALQIIQENSKILSRILSKQNILDNNKDKVSIDLFADSESINPLEKSVTITSTVSPLLRESNSDSLIGLYKKRSNVSESNENNDVKVRPISIDDPFSLETRNLPKSESVKISKTPSAECIPNKTDLYGWENKGFLAKYKSDFVKHEKNYDFKNSSQTSDISSNASDKLKPAVPSEWRHSFSGESKKSVTLPSSDTKDTVSYDRKYISDEYNFPLSKKYNDYVLSKASDICSKTVDQGPKICDKSSKTDYSQVSDFAHVVTSSISFTYEPSGEDDSPIGAKTNSSDTLCQIASLDQVSTPMSPKVFPKETPTLPKDLFEKSDRSKLECSSDDTCSAITSLIETDTLSSLSYPRSPSTGSYHPFPTRPALRMPKELGVRLGMYPKDVLSSSPK